MIIEVISGLLPSSCLNWKIYCDDHSSLSYVSPKELFFDPRGMHTRRSSEGLNDWGSPWEILVSKENCDADIAHPLPTHNPQFLWISREVIAVMLVQVFWEFDSIVMQNLSQICHCVLHKHGRLITSLKTIYSLWLRELRFERPKVRAPHIRRSRQCFPRVSRGNLLKIWFIQTHINVYLQKRFIEFV